MQQQAEKQLVDGHGAEQTARGLLFMQKQAENNAGQERRQGKARKIGPDGEQDGPQEISQGSYRAAGQRPEENGSGGNGNKAEADPDIPGVDGAESGQHNFDGGQNADGDKGAGIEFFHDEASFKVLGCHKKKGFPFLWQRMRVQHRGAPAPSSGGNFPSAGT